MKKAIVLVLVLGLITSVVAGCGVSQEDAVVTADQPYYAIVIQYEEFGDYPHFSLKTECEVNRAFTVKLGSNPTTGYQWSESAQIKDSTVLEQIDHNYVPPEEDGVIGSAGKEVWTFKALSVGTTEVFMEYSELWEGGEKGRWTVTITVDVK